MMYSSTRDEKFALFPGPHVRSRYRERELSGCGLIGFINTDRRRVAGDKIRRGLCNMEERGNGLGSGFAGYGIYPEWPDHYALHMMYQNRDVIADVEKFLRSRLVIDHEENIPCHPGGNITDHPFFRRYFCHPKPPAGEEAACAPDPDELMVRFIFDVNTRFGDAFVISAGKNMGVFKGVGFPADIADFFMIERYEGWTWTGHNRFPTNTQGWWGGAHPFSMLDWTIVHNGEISSYGINKRFLEERGYICTLMTDTEVVAYLMDLLVRRHGLSFDEACSVLAPPFWKDIDRMPEPQRTRATELRIVYAGASLNGPFAFLLGFSGGLIGLNDRVKLRPLVVGKKGDTVYYSSEEAAIWVLEDGMTDVWAPPAGQPHITFFADSREEAQGAAAAARA